jgi:hypothetical protein
MEHHKGPEDMPEGCGTLIDPESSYRDKDNISRCNKKQGPDKNRGKPNRKSRKDQQGDEKQQRHQVPETDRGKFSGNIDCQDIP